MTKKGFTLIELLIVVLIIAILSAVALPKYNSAVIKSKLTEYILQNSAITRAQQVYFLANGSYSPSLDNLHISFGTQYSPCYSYNTATQLRTVYVSPEKQLFLVEDPGDPHWGVGHASNDARCITPQTLKEVAIITIRAEDTSRPFCDEGICTFCRVSPRAPASMLQACASLGTFAGEDSYGKHYRIK